MEIKVDVYYENKKVNSFELFHVEITEEDIARIAKEKAEEQKPLWMTEDWEFDSVTLDKIELY